MKGTLMESARLDAQSETGSRGLTLVAALCAFLITGLVFAGYAYLRKRHAQQQALATPQAPAVSSQPHGPAKVEIFVDDALLEGDQTIIGGTVKNIWSGNLGGLSVDMELRRRKDGSLQMISAQVDPVELAPQQEGHYSVRLSSADYSSARLVALKSVPDSALLAYAISPGKKRPPEKLQGKTVIVNRPTSQKGGFLNTPENPVRIP